MTRNGASVTALVLVAGLLGGVAGGAVVAARGATAQPAALTGGRFVLLDSGGAQRGVLEITPGGAAHLALTGSNGQTPRASLAVSGQDGPEVALRDGLGAVRAALRVEADGTVSLDLKDGRDRLRTTLGVGPDGDPYLSFLDREGSVVWSAP